MPTDCHGGAGGGGAFQGKDGRPPSAALTAAPAQSQMGTGSGSGIPMCSSPCMQRTGRAGVPRSEAALALPCEPPAHLPQRLAEGNRDGGRGGVLFEAPGNVRRDDVNDGGERGVVCHVICDVPIGSATLIRGCQADLGMVGERNGEVGGCCTWWQGRGARR